jgi:hypothetical protein
MQEPDDPEKSTKIQLLGQLQCFRHFLHQTLAERTGFLERRERCCSCERQ